MSLKLRLIVGLALTAAAVVSGIHVMQMDCDPYYLEYEPSAWLLWALSVSAFYTMRSVLREIRAKDF